MYREHTVGVVVPAYNEAGFVGDVIRGLPGYVDRIYAVDDGSTDDTWSEITALADASAEPAEPAPAEAELTDGGLALSRRVVPLRHGTNRGAGAAIKTGYRRALEEGMDVTATVDGDGQMDVDQLDRLLDPIVEGEADYAKGNRLRDREYWAEMPRFRRIGNRLLSVLTKIASGYWQMTDAQNGFTAISREALATVRVEELYEYYGYCDELLVRLNVNDLRVADVPMPAKYGDEVSDIRYAEYIPRVSSMLLRNFLWRLRTKYLVLSFHPLVFAYLAGFASVGLAGLFALLGAVTVATGGAVLPYATSALAFLLFGALFGVLAMVVEYDESRHLVVAVE